MLLPIIALLTTPLMRVTGVAASPNAKQVFHQLDVTLNPLSDKKVWFVKVERQLPLSQIPVWQKLQKQVPANSKHYAELSFMLAYYGVDYDANLRRITRPYRLWQQYNWHDNNYRKYEKEYPDSPEEDWVTWGGTWFPLNLLYLKNHDMKSLGAWLEQELDTAPAECSDDALGELWKQHKTDMLRAAYGSEPRLNELAKALAFDYTDDMDKKAERQLLAEFSRLEQNDDPQVASAARQVYGKIKAKVATWRHHAMDNKRIK